MAVRDIIQAAAGVGGGGGEYIEDVFSTYLYTGNGSTQTITNGIDLAGEGGMVWAKSRNVSVGVSHLVDTERGYDKLLDTASTSGTTQDYGEFAGFNSDGFSLGGTVYAGFNSNSYNYASWTFRKAPKFFDVVTYTGQAGQGDASITIPHNLGSVPGCIIVKSSSGDGNWYVWHRGLSANKYITLNSTGAQLTDNGYYFGNTTVGSNIPPTSTEFYVAQGNPCGYSGQTYVAYLFAHDAGGFGDDGEQNVISCGSYVGGSADLQTIKVNLGWEPQWVLIKSSNRANSQWVLIDNMRGTRVRNDGYPYYQELRPNNSLNEAEEFGATFDASGLSFLSGNHNVCGSNSNTYIYIAIRRPMKTPESGTEVFAVDTFKGTTTLPNYNSGFVTDMGVSRVVNSSQNWNWGARVTGPGLLQSDGTPAEITDSNKTWDFMDGYNKSTSSVNSNNYSWMFRRAPGFFDVVAYTGNGVNNTARNHSLGVVPELIIFKGRSLTSNWPVYCQYLNNETSQNNWQLSLNSTGAQNNNTQTFGNQPATSSVFYTGGNITDLNSSGQTYIAYLFASCPGVSKLGSFTQVPPVNTVVDCGFSNGARFVLIKRISSAGSWYLWDSVRGIVSGNDPYLRLENTGPEITASDCLIPNSSGFETNGNWLDGGTYIYLAIA